MHKEEQPMILKNAIKNLGRNSGRTILVSAVVVIIMIASACSMIVHTSAKQKAKQQMEQIGASVIIVRNDDNIKPDLSNYREISAIQMKSFTTSSLLQSSEIYVSATGKTELTTIAGSSISSAVESDGSTTNQGTLTDVSQMESPNVLLIGTNNPNINDDFKQGIRKIVEGTSYKNNNEIVIGEELAKKNNLKVGDTFTIKLVDYSTSKNAPALQVKIAGIFEDHKPMSDTDVGSLNKHNELFMNYETLEAFAAANATQGGFLVEGQFHLKDPKEVTALEQEFHDKGMPEFFELSVNQAAYDKSVAPLVQIANVTQMFTLVILGTGTLILIALSLLAIRERKYEIGVLRAMGMKKIKIGLMLCMEMCTITIGCSLLALGLANLAAQPIADMMLANMEPVETIQFGAFYIGSGNVEQITQFDAAMSVEAIMLLLVAAIVLGLLGSAAGVWYITKHEPMRILAERN